MTKTVPALLAVVGLLVLGTGTASAFGTVGAAGGHRIFALPRGGTLACQQGSQRACEALERLGRLQPLSRDRQRQVVPATPQPQPR